MIYTLENDIFNKESMSKININDNKLFICSLSLKEFGTIAKKFNINEKIMNDCLNGRTTKFESYEGADYIAAKIPNLDDLLSHSKRVCIYLTDNILMFVSDDNDLINDIIFKCESGEIKCANLSKLFYVFFDKLTADDTYHIESIEQEIIELEDGLLTSKDDNYLNKIIVLRKKLLKLKRYYERLYSIAENIEENENELIDEKTIRYFRMFTNRINRLYQGVNNLRDYVTQVREAYQAQVDINQNTLMKLFTVVTTIFLPLTLIVGWYGMNLKMPEYNLDYSYPVVIVVSISIVILCIVSFKKNKWI